MKVLLEKLDPLLKDILGDRLSATELVDFLDLSVYDVIEAFEDTILENLAEVEDYIGYTNLDDENDE